MPVPARGPIRHGRIVFTWIEDRRAHGKLRPAIILTEDAAITDDTELVVMAVTTTFPDPPPAICVPLPWHPRGHPVTGLNKRSAAVVNWLSVIRPSDVVGFGGDVPETIMHLIDSKLDELHE